MFFNSLVEAVDLIDQLMSTDGKHLKKTLKVIISKIFILFYLAAPMVITSNCRYIFGSHGTKRSRSLFSNLITNK